MSLRHPRSEVSGMREKAIADDDRLVVQRFQTMKMILRAFSVPMCVVGSPPSHHQPGASHCAGGVLLPVSLECQDAAISSVLRLLLYQLFGL